MNLRQIEFFVAVVDLGSFTEAAAELGVAQSTVSSGISALERSVGGPLLDRTTRSATPTSRGRSLLPAARDALDAVRRMRQGGSDSGGLRGRLRIGVVTGLETLGLPRIVSTYASRYRHVDLSLRVHPQGSTGLIADTRQGRLDVAIISTWQTQLEGMVVTPLARRPFAVLVHRGHPLAECSEIGLEDMPGEAFIDMPPGFGTRDQIDAAFERLGMRRRVALEVPDQATLPAYVGTGLGVAITTVAKSDSCEVVQVPLRGLPPQQVSIIHRASPVPQAVPFVELLQGGRQPRDAGG